MGPCIVIIFQYISNNMQRYTVYFIWKLLYIFRVIPPPIIRSANNCIYSIWYLSRRYCYLPLSWKSWNRFECAVGGDIYWNIFTMHGPINVKSPNNTSKWQMGFSSAFKGLMGKGKRQKIYVMRIFVLF
jgi:hypothetical protein